MNKITKNYIVIFSILVLVFCIGRCVIAENSNNLKFEKVGNLNIARCRHTATLLQDGRVLIIGGRNSALPFNHQTLKSTEIYDPKTKKFTMGPDMLFAREKPVAVLLNDGRVFIIGGWADDDKPGTVNANGRYIPGPGEAGIRTTEFYDPITNKFYQGPELIIAQNEMINGFIPLILDDGKIMLKDVGSHIPSTEIYNPKDNTFNTVVKDIRWWSGALVNLDNGNVLVISYERKKTFIFNPKTETYSSGPDMNYQRRGGIVVKLNDKRVLICGGQEIDTNNKILNSCEYYNAALNKFIMFDSNMTKPRMGSDEILLNNGNFLIFGGYNHLRGSQTDIEIFSPKTNTFYKVKYDTNHYAPTITQLKDNTVLFAGGRVPPYRHSTNKAFVLKY
ncbi:MAG: kelch repeat-containing protein [bacterium]